MSLRPLLAATALLGASATPVVLAPPAAALSCVPRHLVIEDVSQVFTGRITDADAGRILVEVEQVRRGPALTRVWLPVDLPEWTAWAGEDGTIPDGYSSPHTWLFARLDDGSVNACTVWPVNRGRPPHSPETSPTPTAGLPTEAASPSPGAPAPAPGDAPSRLAGVAAAAGGLATMFAVVILLARQRRRGP